MPATAKKTVKLDKEAHASLKKMAEEDGLTLTEELSTLVEEKRRQRMFDQADEAYAQLREDEEAWADYQEEVEELEGAQADGLEGYE